MQVWALLSSMLSDFFLFDGGYISSSGAFFSHLFSQIVNMSNKKLFRIMDSLLKLVCWKFLRRKRVISGGKM